MKCYELIKNQIEIARKEIDINKIIERSKSNRELVQKFYSEFCAKLNLKRWEEVFEKYYNWISYYRIDSALIADRIIMGHPTMGIIHPTRLEDYYGVRFKELEKLIDANIFFH